MYPKGEVNRGIQSKFVSGKKSAGNAKWTPKRLMINDFASDNDERGGGTGSLDGPPLAS